LLFYATSCTSCNGKDEKIGRIAVVHMDEKFHQSEKIEIKHKEIELRGEGWEDRDSEKIRPWKDGLLLAYRAGATSPYALIDTAAGTMELWQPAGEYEWLNDECADFKWNQIGGLCLKKIPDTTGFVLLKNKDTLAVRYADKPPVEYDRFSVYFIGKGIGSGGWRYLIDKQGKVLALDVWGGVSRFFDKNGNLLVNYQKGGIRGEYDKNENF
jgi:hypothetical protein